MATFTPSLDIAVRGWDTEHQVKLVFVLHGNEELREPIYMQHGTQIDAFVEQTRYSYVNLRRLCVREFYVPIRELNTMIAFSFKDSRRHYGGYTAKIVDGDSVRLEVQSIESYNR